MGEAVLSQRYELKTKLGEGGMAAVYLAYDQRMKIDRAVKLLLPHVSMYPQISQRFEMEASTMANLHHKNIVTVYDITNHDDLIYMVMDFLSGGSLMDRIRRHGKLHPVQAIDATIDMLRGLAHAHDNRVIHRDIKPHNLLISNDGVVQISDFGIARAEDSGSDMTQTGAVLGTICYMSPEQRRDSKSCTEKSDLFSAGATFFTLLTDQQPMDISFKSIQEELFKDLDEDVAEFLRKSCHADPEERFHTAQEMITELEKMKESRDALPEDAHPIFMLCDFDDISSLGSDPGHQSIIKAISKSSETNSISPEELEKLNTKTPTIYPNGDDTGTIFFDDLDDDFEEEQAQPQVETEHQKTTVPIQSKKPMVFISFVAILAALIAIVLMLPKKDTPTQPPTKTEQAESSQKSETNGNPSSGDKSKKPSNQGTSADNSESNKEATAYFVLIDTLPTGANILMDGQPFSITPHKMEVDPKNPQTVTLQLSGYESQNLKLRTDSPKQTVRLNKIKSNASKKAKATQKPTKKIKIESPKKPIKKKTIKKKPKTLGSGPVNPF